MVIIAHVRRTRQGPGPLAKLPVLDFLHAGGLDALKRGRGAPWALRIAYETLIDVPAVARNGGIARLEYPMRGDGEATLEAMLYPSGRLNLSRDWPQFLAALKVVDCFAVPADGGKSAWLPIRVRSYPVRDGGVLRLDVSLPPGSDKGPRILRRVLRRLGARSYPQWRAWLALAYLWDRSAVNGHWVRATRPRLARDSGGRLVDRTGTVILDRRGALAAFLHAVNPVNSRIKYCSVFLRRAGEYAAGSDFKGPCPSHRQNHCPLATPRHASICHHLNNPLPCLLKARQRIAECRVVRTHRLGWNDHCRCRWHFPIGRHVIGNHEIIFGGSLWVGRFDIEREIALRMRKHGCALRVTAKNQRLELQFGHSGRCQVESNQALSLPAFRIPD